MLPAYHLNNTRQIKTPTHPEPDTTTELGFIAVSAADLRGTLNELHEQDIPLTTAEVEAAIGGLRAITQHSTRTAWQLGLHAVERGLISQAELAKLLGASTTSVSRRFHDGLDETEAHKIARTDVRTTPLK